MDVMTAPGSELFDEAIRGRDQGEHADAESLFRVGIDRFPADLDRYGHPRFRKELIRMLLSLRQWERAKALCPEPNGIDHFLQDNSGFGW